MKRTVFNIIAGALLMTGLTTAVQAQAQGRRPSGHASSAQTTSPRGSRPQSSGNYERRSSSPSPSSSRPQSSGNYERRSSSPSPSSSRPQSSGNYERRSSSPTPAGDRRQYGDYERRSTTTSSGGYTRRSSSTADNRPQGGDNRRGGEASHWPGNRSSSGTRYTGDRPTPTRVPNDMTREERGERKRDYNDNNTTRPGRDGNGTRPGGGDNGTRPGGGDNGNRPDNGGGYNNGHNHNGNGYHNGGGDNGGRRPGDNYRGGHSGGHNGGHNGNHYGGGTRPHNGGVNHGGPRPDYDRYRYNHNMRPRHHDDRFFHHYSRNDWSWRHPVRPPHRPYRPVSLWYYRPYRPYGYTIYASAPIISGVLGLEFGTRFGDALNFLYYNGYEIDGYYDNIVYLRDVPMLDYTWPDVMMQYDSNGLAYVQFTYSNYYDDRVRFNRLYHDLCAYYGTPLRRTGMAGQFSWYGGDGIGFVNLGLTFNNGRYYTSLSFGL